MKKLMFAAALAAAFACQSQAVESQVVGYENYSLVKGYNLYSPMFQDVSGTKQLNIQDIKLTGITQSGKSKIVLLNENGKTVGSYMWYFADDAEGKDGWFDDNAWEYYNFNITEGQGFYIYIAPTESGSDFGVQVAGGVKLGDWSIPLQKGYNLVGNCSPVDLNIQKLTLSGITQSGKSKIVLLNENGKTVGSYMWYFADDAEGKDGWFDDNAWEYYNLNWPAGKGMYLYIAPSESGSDFKLNIPKALGE